LSYSIVLNMTPALVFILSNLPSRIQKIQYADIDHLEVMGHLDVE